MQDLLPAVVLNSEVLLRQPMNDTPPNSPFATPSAAGASPNDERLMLDFTLGSSEAFPNSFAVTSSPSTGSSAAASPILPTPKSFPRKPGSPSFAPPPATNLGLS